MLKTVRSLSAFGVARGAALAAIVSLTCLAFTTNTAVGESSADVAYTTRLLDDPARVVGPRECGECHEDAVDVWMESAHYQGAAELTRNDRAKEIASALGIRRIKSEARCTSCHYTVQEQNGRTKAVAGVSCESCHGGAAEWMELHDRFGGPDATAETETPEHRAQRLAACDEAGMAHGASLSKIGARCHACHTIADEELVNVGGHPVPDALELVSWSQGEVRHNFVSGEGAANAESPLERRRSMFLIGQSLRLEYALRALAVASTDGPFAESALARLEAATTAVQAIAERIDCDGVRAILATLDGVPLEPGGGEALRTAADRIHAVLVTLEPTLDGAALAALDELLPGAEAYRGAPR